MDVVSEVSLTVQKGNVISPEELREWTYKAEKALGLYEGNEMIKRVEGWIDIRTTESGNHRLVLYKVEDK